MDEPRIDPNGSGDVATRARTPVWPGEPSPAERGGTGPSAPPPQIDGYDCVRLIGRGGQGVVFEALQHSTRQRVAIKVLPPHFVTDEIAQARFRTEVKIVGALNHPGVIAIFDSGASRDGRPYYVMDYVSGLPLHKYVRQQRLSLRETVGLFVDVCDAVQHAHQQGVIHRDLKPSNVLVDSNGRPRVLDFGLAKLTVDGDLTRHTAPGSLLGTLPYMAPEQVSNGGAIDVRSDVYALGVMLYEVLTGRLPYPAGESLATARHILETDPAPLRRNWDPKSGVGSSSARSRRRVCPLDGELESVVRQALAKEQRRRYQTAGALGQDLERYLNGEPLDARRNALTYTVWKLVKRRRATVLAIGACLVMAGTATVVVTQYAREAAAARAEVARQADQAARGEARMLQGDGKWAAAAARLGELYRLNPDDSRLLFEQADSLRRAGQHSSAYRLLLDHGGVLANEPAYWSLLGMLAPHVEPGRELEFRERARQLASSEADSLHLTALIEPDHEKAVELLTAALDAQPDHFDAVVARSTRAFAAASAASDPEERERYTLQSLTDCEAAIRMRPYMGFPWYNFGTLLINLDQPDEAVKKLTRAAELLPSVSKVWFNLGSAHYHRGDWAACHDALTQAMHVDPNDALIRQLRGHCSRLMGRHARAIEELTSVAAYDPEADVRFAAATDLFMLQAFDDAKRMLADVGADEAGYPRAALLRGRIAEARGDFAAALDHYALEVSAADSASVRASLVHLYADPARPDAAGAAEQLAPLSDRALQSPLANALIFRVNETASAPELLEAAAVLEADSESAWAGLVLADMLRRVGEPAEAMRLLDANATPSDGPDPLFESTHAWVSAQIPPRSP